MAVGVCACLRPDDRSPARTADTGTSSPRAATCDRMMAELYGRVTGYCGRQGRVDAHLRARRSASWGPTASSAEASPTRWGRPCPRSCSAGTRGRVVLRRRGVEPGGAVRVDEPRRAVAAAGRSSSARTTCTASGRTTSGSRRVALAERARPVRHPVVRGRRHRRAGRPRRRRRGGPTGPGRPRAHPDRGSHLHPVRAHGGRGGHRGKYRSRGGDDVLGDPRPAPDGWRPSSLAPGSPTRRPSIGCRTRSDDGSRRGRVRRRASAPTGRGRAAPARLPRRPEG